MKKETTSYIIDAICLSILQFVSFCVISGIFTFTGLGIFWMMSNYTEFSFIQSLFISIFVPVGLLAGTLLDYDKEIDKLKRKYKI